MEHWFEVCFLFLGYRGKPLDINGKTKISPDGTLVVSNIEEEDGGDYSCHVQNDFGKDNVTYSIIILG